jgi:hypothetical protein
MSSLTERCKRCHNIGWYEDGYCDDCRDALHIPRKCMVSQPDTKDFKLVIEPEGRE